MELSLSRWRRIVRGMIGTGLTFAATVGVAGTIVGLLLGALSWDDLRMVAKLAVIAFLVGVLYSGVLAIAARGRTFDRLSLRFVTALGGGGGLPTFCSLPPPTGPACGPSGTRSATWRFSRYWAVDLPQLP